MICKNCGNEIPNGVERCEFCNTAVNDNSQAVSNEVEKVTQADEVEVKAASNKPKKKGILIAIASVLLVAVIGVGTSIAYSRFSDNNSSSKTTQHNKHRDDDDEDDEDDDDDDDDNSSLTFGGAKGTTATEENSGKPNNGKGDETIPSESEIIETTPVETTVAETTPVETTPVVMNDPVPDGAASWTVLVYMCGSNLESGNGIGSYVLDRMDDMPSTDNVNILVETGGSPIWRNDDPRYANDAVSQVTIPSDALGRYQVKENEILDLGSVPFDSMGKASTLSDFISWGKENYPAQKYMLVLWNHGYVEPYGCLESDDVFYEDDQGNVYIYTDVPANTAVRNDCLTLDELSKGLNDGGVRFELVTFNTCLSASIEIAAAVAPYSNYMVASEESIPAMIGIPEQYIAYLNMYPNSTGLDVGKFICEQYDSAIDIIIENTDYNEKNDDMFGKSTLGVIDLSGFNEMQECFNDVMKHIYYSTYDMTTYTGFLNAATMCENYGSAGNVEGNLIDLKSFLINSAPYLTDTDSDEKLISLIDSKIYAISGPTRLNSYGLSFYFPSYNYVVNLKSTVESELLDANISLTDSQKEEIITNYITRTMNVYIDNINDNFEYFWYAAYLGYRFNDYWTPGEEVDELINNYIDDDHVDVEVIDKNEFNVQYNTELDSDGNFILNVTEGAEGVISVEMNSSLVIVSDDPDSSYTSQYTYFGATALGIDADYSTGTFIKDLNFEWYYVGVYPVPVYSIEDSENQTIYGFRANVNREEVIIAFAHDKVTDECYMLYAMRLDENDGVASNDIFKLHEGDQIDVYFFSLIYGVPGGFWDEDGEIFIRPFHSFEYSENESIVSVGPLFGVADLKIIVNYTITDAFGNQYYTDFVQYSIPAGKPDLTTAELIDDVPAKICEELYQYV